MVAEIRDSHCATVGSLHALRTDMMDLRDALAGMRGELTGAHGEVRHEFALHAAGQQQIVPLLQGPA